MPEIAQACALCLKNGPNVNPLKYARRKSYWYRGILREIQTLKMLIHFTGTDCQTADQLNHKENCKAQNYNLKITLNPKDITNPPITRTLSYPATATWKELHTAVQISYVQARTYTYDFKVKDSSRGPGEELDVQAFIVRMMTSP